MDGGSPDGNDGQGGGSPLTILAVIAGVALLYWLATSFVEWNKVQSCVGYGGRNCAPRIDLQAPAR
ncbi:MAG TPA: hypothetical protein VKY65_06620 [Alphaproteobacteria bacterium]|nr:hypothetical protein [Alphaproteobacteria bacterium]